MLHRFHNLIHGMRPFQPRTVCSIEGDDGDAGGEDTGADSDDGGDDGDDVGAEPGDEDGEDGSDAADAPRTYTQAEFEERLRAEKRKLRRSMAKAQKTPKKTTTAPKAKATKKPEPAVVDDDDAISRNDVKDALRDIFAFSDTRPASREQFEDVLDVAHARILRGQLSLDDLEDELPQWASRGLLGKSVTASTKPPNGTAAPAKKPAPGNPDVQHPAPRQVKDLSGETGYVDVFSLTEQECEELGMVKVVELYEKAKQAHRRRSGAPPKPAVLRDRPRR